MNDREPINDEVGAGFWVGLLNAIWLSLLIILIAAIVISWISS